MIRRFLPLAAVTALAACGAAEAEPQTPRAAFEEAKAEALATAAKYDELLISGFLAWHQDDAGAPVYSFCGRYTARGPGGDGRIVSFRGNDGEWTSRRIEEVRYRTEGRWNQHCLQPVIENGERIDYRMDFRS